MEDKEESAKDQATQDQLTANRAKLEDLTKATKDVETEATEQRGRSLELNASFYEKLTALNAASIALSVSVGAALFEKATPHSAFLHSNLTWLVVVAFFLWFSLICAFGHNLLFIRIARLESEKAAEWSKWIGLINASAMQSITGRGDSESAQTVNKVIADTLHVRIQRAAMNLHRTDQTILRAKILGYLAIRAFLVAYTLIFVCIIRIWWMTR